MSTLHQVSVDLPEDILGDAPGGAGAGEDAWMQTDPRYCLRAGRRLVERLTRQREQAVINDPELRKLAEVTVAGLNMLACRALRQSDSKIVAPRLKETLMDDALQMLREAGEICGGGDMENIEGSPIAPTRLTGCLQGRINACSCKQPPSTTVRVFSGAAETCPALFVVSRLRGSRGIILANQR